MQTTTRTHEPTAKPEGYRSITPYLVVDRAARLIEFLKDAFGAQEIARYSDEGGAVRHAQIWIGDSIIEVADSLPEYPPMPTSLHLFVPNVDEVYSRAIAAGATSYDPIVDQPYEDREGGVVDPSGNHWYIATHLGGSYVRPPLSDVTPYLHAVDTPSYIEFLKASFGAEVVEHYGHENGAVMHAKLRVGDSIIEMGEAHGKYSPMPTAFHLYVADVDATFAKAVAAGGVEVSAPENKPYGQRAADMRDPMGNRWFIAQLL